jgi:phosphotriesterase-related protein
VVTIQTIRGPIDTSELGMTLSHEHFTTSAAGIERFPEFYNEEECLDVSLEALRRVRQVGIDSIIDLTTFDLGRQVSLFQKAAEANTGVNVVCATGAYRWVPAYLGSRDPDEIADHFLREIQDGIHGTGIRAGIIKLAWDMEYRLSSVSGRSPRGNLERTARGAARAAKAGGVPISCHTLAFDELGTPLLDIFEDEGLDLRAVTIGHSNDSINLDYLKGMAARGATVGLDRFGLLRGQEELERRSALALSLIRAGYAEQVCLGHDGNAYPRMGASRPGNPDCWLPVSQIELPWLRAHGATDDDIDAVMRRSIRATFEAAAAMATEPVPAVAAR